MKRNPPAAPPAISCSATDEGAVASPIATAATAAGSVILFGMIR